MKDNFSSKSHNYAKFRPEYPVALFHFLEELINNTDCAWDCGTGNGQVASSLATIFSTVKATDISAAQLQNAVQKENIEYSKQAAEKNNFPNHSFDLITVAQAIHWFDFQNFYAEVSRTLKPDGILAVIGYGLLKIDPETDRIIRYFYEEIIGEYWDEERRYLEEEYRSIPFPFREISCPSFERRLKWDFQHLIGYLETWSAVKHYEKATGRSPVKLIQENLEQRFGVEGEVRFPVLLRVGALNKDL